MNAPKSNHPAWRPFTHAGITYDLGHLQPATVFFVVPAIEGKPEIRFTVDVTYSTHCFTRALPGDGSICDPLLTYRDGREIRLFDHRRYALSKQLPAIIEGLLRRKCMHTGRGNFFTVALVDEKGHCADYDVFFTPSKSSTKERLNLFIQSAYVRDREKLPSGRSIRFEIILYNVLHNKPFRS